MDIRKLSDQEILELLYEQRALLRGLHLKKIKDFEHDYILEGLISGNEDSIDDMKNKLAGTAGFEPVESGNTDNHVLAGLNNVP